jgi:tripeptide aminopeptidase
MVESIVDNVIAKALQIQQIPAPTFDEKQRAKFIFQEFVDENLLDVEIDEDSNVFARIAGRGNAKQIILSAHTDTVFSKEVDLGFWHEENLLFGPGIGDNSFRCRRVIRNFMEIERK